MASNYQFQQHISHILNRKTYSLSKVRAGDVILFKYNAKIDNPTDINPLVLVCNTNFNGELHGVNINYLDRRQIQTLAGNIGLTAIYPNKDALVEAKNKGLPLVRVKCRESQGFYSGVIKPQLKSLVKTPSAAYRTYSLGRIGGVQLVDYSFGLQLDKLQREKANK